MGFSVTFSAEAERDFLLIADFLVESYLEFGEPAKEALEHARSRAQEIRESAVRIARAPFRGTLHNNLAPGLRHVTIGRTVVWFKVIEESEEVLVVGIFFGGQDHHRHMLARLLSEL